MIVVRMPISCWKISVKRRVKMQGLLMIDMQKAFDNSSWGERNNPQLEVNSQKIAQFF